MKKVLPFSTEGDPRRVAEEAQVDLWVQMSELHVNRTILRITMAALLTAVENSRGRKRKSVEVPKKSENNPTREPANLEAFRIAVWSVLTGGHQASGAWRVAAQFMLERFKYQLLSVEELRRRAEVRAKEYA